MAAVVLNGQRSCLAWAGRRGAVGRGSRCGGTPLVAYGQDSCSWGFFMSYGLGRKVAHLGYGRKLVPL